MWWAVVLHLVSSAELGLDFQFTTMQTARMRKRASQCLVSAATVCLLFLAAAAEAARWSHGDALNSNGQVRNPSSPWRPPCHLSPAEIKLSSWHQHPSTPSVSVAMTMLLREACGRAGVEISTPRRTVDLHSTTKRAFRALQHTIAICT